MESGSVWSPINHYMLRKPCTTSMFSCGLIALNSTKPSVLRLKLYTYAEVRIVGFTASNKK